MTTTKTDMLIEELTLTLDEFARACQRDPHWVMMHVESELIGSVRTDKTTVLFTSTDLIRARRLANIESTFDTNEDAAAFIVDLIEEVERLKRLIT